MFVRTPARLHFGVLNPSGGSLRKYGGVGLSVDGIGYSLEGEKSDCLEILGSTEQKERARKIIQKISQAYDLSSEVKVKINESIPPHVGLGSTTQLSLALGKILAILFQKDFSTLELAKKIGRGKRSAIGTYVFDRGGLIVEGGRSGEEFPPLILRDIFPKKWRFVVAIPNVERGPEEEDEDKYFEGLERNENISKEICYILVLKLLPALKRNDISDFGEALTKIDEKVGKAFSTKQGGVFGGGAVSETRDYMLDEGAYGVGQSSWGPTVYGLVKDQEEARHLRESVENFYREEGFLGDVLIVKPDNRGAEIKKSG
ncbi:hypothetical protein AKJ38_03370 [candidate division MSBL1 archaeon SCGC-AAA259I14]|uniref:Beta-ribofuranosylaminobenzene 5'-phosphate synthase n=4 Tax=candidate division MSBL1 TaxID=215777 RepID=A0A133UQC0_9EURY|nr:hypothetical protein AKJ61_01010 [candidate division MSBL1 archaeon SCGC-AAA259B11]KXA92365.1 hypothetical protein AKJ66_04285 [candidate division MSBL1 archaeon SCGC-AAA259E22]KXA96395.1 hypothetical protein AKJ38_03370 [candidate division MSBL1 archaeon SCGC-AAA259I14]